MSRILLALTATASENVDPAQLERWRAPIQQRFGSKKSPRPHADPREVVVELDYQVDPDDLVPACREAFRVAEMKTGVFELAVSKHPAEDVDLETPPYFEHRFDLAHLDHVRPHLHLTTVHQRTNPDLRLVGKLLTPEQGARFRAALCAELPTATVEPYRTYDRREHLDIALAPCDSAAAPEKALLIRAAVAAAAAAGIQPVPFLLVRARGEEADWDEACCEQIEAEHRGPASIDGTVRAPAGMKGGMVLVAVRTASGHPGLAQATMAVARLEATAGDGPLAACFSLRALPEHTPLELRVFPEAEPAWLWAQHLSPEPPQATVTTASGATPVTLAHEIS